MDDDEDIIDAEFIDTTPPREPIAPTRVAVAVASAPGRAIVIPGRPMPPDAPEPRAPW